MSMARAMLLLGLITLQVLCLVDCYPNGAPTGACKDMMPKHAGVVPQPSPAPYSILTNTKRYQAGMPVTVTIIGPQYRGVLLEARTEGFNDAYGTWKLPPPDTKFLQSFFVFYIFSGPCKAFYLSIKPFVCVPHFPCTRLGVFTILFIFCFRATVAQQRTVYWLNVRSNILTNGRYSTPDCEIKMNA
uniref:Si:dkey-251i10.2 n=1 Tax=Fundulus heteroclitus TaxID=8078 RepID=A0A3Q2PMC5_FUNHE